MNSSNPTNQIINWRWIVNIADWSWCGDFLHLMAHRLLSAMSSEPISWFGSEPVLSNTGSLPKADTLTCNQEKHQSWMETTGVSNSLDHFVISLGLLPCLSEVVIKRIIQNCSFFWGISSKIIIVNYSWTLWRFIHVWWQDPAQIYIPFTEQFPSNKFSNGFLPLKLC